jgi:hypothetical protein
MKILLLITAMFMAMNTLSDVCYVAVKGEKLNKVDIGWQYFDSNCKKGDTVLIQQSSKFGISALVAGLCDIEKRVVLVPDDYTATAVCVYKGKREFKGWELREWMYGDFSPKGERYNGK